MEEIEVKELFQHFKNNFAQFLLITFSIFFVGCMYMVFVQKPLYTSSTTLVLTGVESNESINSTITTNDITINAKLVSTYREIAKSRRVLEQVVAKLGLSESVDGLASSINISSVSDTEIIRISVTNANPGRARIIADTLASVFSKEIVEIYNVKNISKLDPANLPAYPSNINKTKQFVLYFGFGFAVACFILFLTFYFDTTIKSVEQVEEKTSLPILGSVPNYDKKRGKRK